MYNINDVFICKRNGFSLFEKGKEYTIEKTIKKPSGIYYKVKGYYVAFSKDMIDKYLKKVR